MPSTEQYQHVDSYAGWFKQYEQESEKNDIVSLPSVQPYIDFKLAYDFAFTTDNSIEIQDPVAINYFMGNFCYKQVKRDFQRSAIVLQTQTERLYFGSPYLTKKRMRSMTLQMEKPADGFENFISVLEEKVFKCGVSNLDERKKDTLGMILRIVNQGVSAVAMKMVNGYLQVRSGNCDASSFGGGNDISWLMRPDASDEKGSTQIDIICGDKKIQLSRREYIKVQKLDEESLLDPDDTKAERWCILILLTRTGPEESSDWNIHFSASKVKGNYEETDLCSPESYGSSARASGLGCRRRVCLTDTTTEVSNSEPRTSLSGLLNFMGKSRSSNCTVRQNRKGGRRSIRHLMVSRNGSKVPKPIKNADWLKQYEDDTKLTTIPFQEVHPYIDFKLAHSLSFSEDSFIETKDLVVINYLLGDFSYNWVRQGFCQNAIVLITQTEKLYFGSAAALNDHDSAEIESSKTDSSACGFDAFITSLERNVFKDKLYALNEHKKETLGMILRFLGQNISAVPMKMLNRFLQTRSTTSAITKPLCVKGSAQICIKCTGDDIHLSRQENMTVKSDTKSKLQLGEEGNVETWKIVTNIVQKSSMKSSNITLRFFMLPQTQLDMTRSNSSSSFSFNQTRTTTAKSDTEDYIPRRDVGMVVNIGDIKDDDEFIRISRRKMAMSKELRDQLKCVPIDGLTVKAYESSEFSFPDLESEREGEEWISKPEIYV